MPEIVHPRLPKDRRVVTVEQLPDWLAAGWLTAGAPDPDPAPTTERRHTGRTTRED